MLDRWLPPTAGSRPSALKVLCPSQVIFSEPLRLGETPASARGRRKIFIIAPAINSGRSSHRGQAAPRACGDVNFAWRSSNPRSAHFLRNRSTSRGQRHWRVCLSRRRIYPERPPLREPRRISDESSEPHEVRMRHNSVRNIDSEVVGRIACASLRHEDEVPRTIIGRSRVCGTR